MGKVSIPRGSFARDVLKLASGSTLAQVLSIPMSPVVARIYAPQAFGTLAVFSSIVGVIGVVGCLRYELAIMLPEKDETAVNAFGLSVLAASFVSGLSATLILPSRDAILQLLNARDLEPYLWLIPPAVLAKGVFLALDYWNSRSGKFGRLSAARVTRSLVTNGSHLGLAVLGQRSAGGLIWSRVLGSASISTALASMMWRDDYQLMAQNLSCHAILQGLKQYIKFPLYSVWAALFSRPSWQLPAMLLSIYFSPSLVGYYALGNRVVQIPVQLIGGSIAQVFFQRSAEAKASGNLAQVVASTYRRLVSLGLFPMRFLSVVGQDLLEVLFGAQWTEARLYTQILSLYMFFNFISAPLAQLFNGLEMQEKSLVVNIGLLLSRLVALCFGGRSGDIRYTLLLFSGSGVIVYGGLSIWLTTAAGVSPSEWVTSILRWLLPSGIALSIGWITSQALQLRSCGTLLAFSVSALAYYAWVLPNDPASLRAWESKRLQ